MQKPIDELVEAALSDQSLIDVLDEGAGIYGREYSVKNAGVSVALSAQATRTTRIQLARAISQMRRATS